MKFFLTVQLNQSEKVKVKGVNERDDYSICYLCFDLSLSLLPRAQDQKGLILIGSEVGEANVYTIARNDV